MNRTQASASSPFGKIPSVLAFVAAASMLGLLTGCASGLFGPSAPSGPGGNGQYFAYFSSNSLIEVSRFNSATGEFSSPVITSTVPGTNWIAVDPSGKYMYATALFPGKDKKDNASGAVAAFAINPHTGLLTLLNEQPTGGSDPAHVAVDPTGRAVIVSNYGGGNVAALPILADGKLGAPNITQHTGKSVDPDRQDKPYPHSAAFDPTGKFAYVQDLGTDKIVIYNFDAATATLTPHDPPFQAVIPGNGPRHIAFDPGFRHAYLIGEMGKNIFVYDYDAASGNFTEKQHISTLPPRFEGSSTGAEVLVTPNGKFLYATNRDLDPNSIRSGMGDIAAFNIDPQEGTLTPIDWVNSGGKIPRSMAIDPTGQWLLCGNQNSGNIVEFKINSTTGRLTQTDVNITLDTPFCEVFIPVKP
jgi:6-phosphogluconolactonase